MDTAEGESDEEDTPGVATDSSMEGLADALTSWFQQWRAFGADSTPTNAPTASPMVLADLAARFTQNQMAISEQIPLARWTVGAMLQLWVLAWLNATLVAEGTALRISGLNQRNMVSVDEDMSVLSYNLMRAEASGSVASLRLFPWLASCPLLRAVMSERWDTQIAQFLRGAQANEDPRLAVPSGGRITSSYSDFGSDKLKHSVFALLCGLSPITGFDDPKPAKDDKDYMSALNSGLGLSVSGSATQGNSRIELNADAERTSTSAPVEGSSVDPAGSALPSSEEDLEPDAPSPTSDDPPKAETPRKAQRKGRGNDAS